MVGGLFQLIESTVKHSTFPFFISFTYEQRRLFLKLECQCQPTINQMKVTGIIFSGESSAILSSSRKMSIGVYDASGCGCYERMLRVDVTMLVDVDVMRGCYEWMLRW